MNTLSKILSSKARAEIFRILFGIDSNECHLREIERRSGLAVDTIRKEAINLELLGLIQKRNNGNRTYYTANKNHPLYETIHNLVLKTSGLSDVLRDSLLIDSIKIAFVFGSIATGKENAYSDVDLFILGNISLRSLSKLLKEPSRKLGREINSYIMTPEEFVQRVNENEHFVTSVLKSPKLMIKGNEDELGRMGKEWLASHT